jgi:hypothetical protein
LWSGGERRRHPQAAGQGGIARLGQTQLGRLAVGKKVKVQARQSRGAVKPEVDEPELEARALVIAKQLIGVTSRQSGC